MLCALQSIIWSLHTCTRLIPSLFSHRIWSIYLHQTQLSISIPLHAYTMSVYHWSILLLNAYVYVYTCSLRDNKRREWILNQKSLCSFDLFIYVFLFLNFSRFSPFLHSDFISVGHHSNTRRGEDVASRQEREMEEDAASYRNTHSPKKAKSKPAVAPELKNREGTQKEGE